MDLEKAYDRVDGKAHWNVLKIYGVGRHLMKGIKAFYREANACVKVYEELSDSFAIGVGVRQGCVMLPLLFNIFMDGCMRKMKAEVGKIRARIKLNGVDWSVAACLFADDTVLLEESERELQRAVDQFHSVCSRRKLRVNAGNSKVMVSDRKEVKVVNSGNPNWVNVPADERCEIVLGGERMEVIRVEVFRNSIKMEGEVREREL